MSKFSNVIDRLGAEDQAALFDELRRRQSGGEKVVNPGQSAVGLASGVAKSVGAGAADLVGGQQNHFSYWDRSWSDPAKDMSPDARKAMLQMSLKEAGYKQSGAFKSMGQFVRAGFKEGKSSDFHNRVRSYYQDMDPNFLRARGVGSTSGESGGFLLMPEFAPTIDQIFFPTSIADRVHKLQISGAHLSWPRAKDTSRADGSRHSGARGYWVEEGAPITDSDLSFGLAKLAMKKLVCVVFFPPELLSDSDYAIEAYLRETLRAELNWQIDKSIMWGGGGADPQGFMNGGSLISVAKESGQAADTVVTENIVKMQARCHSNDGKTPVWLTSKSVGPQVATFDVGNFPVAININNGGIAAAPSRMLRGWEMLDSEFCAQVGSSGDIVAADLWGYKAIMRSLIREDVSMEYAFLTDQNALRVIIGFDGKPLYPSAITPYRPPGSDAVDTLSPFVSLAVRA